ncbi:MAG: hemolysin family protein [Natrialbaceae archaeon]|nr:hemolysin family protein [Natrialbaceae archaeon]
MVEVLPAVGRLVAALALVALNGFFVASEFALVRVRSTAVDQLLAEGRTGATTLQEALDHLDNYLATTQLGITLASLALGWIGEPAVAALLEPVLGSFLPTGTTHLVALVIAFSIVTFLHVVFGELAPKTIAIAEAERLALLIALPLKGFYYLFFPGLIVFNGTANAITSLIGIPPASEADETLSEDEIRLVLGRAGREGSIDIGEVEMIEQVFELDDISARDIMVPRPDVSLIAADERLPAIREFVRECGHTRYPIVDAKTGEQPVGGLDVKDLLEAIEAGDDSASAADMSHEIPIVPESTSVAELLTRFQADRRQLAAIIDEYGTLAGIATVEDVVEVVVGELYDAFDPASSGPQIQHNDDGSATVDGATPLGVFNDSFETTLEVASYGTVGGVVLDRLGRAPKRGDQVTVEDHSIEVLAVDGSRVKTVRVEPQQPRRTHRRLVPQRRQSPTPITNQ